MHYEPYVEIDPYNYNGYDYVEIGGLKWATMNVGANSITDYGLYYQWGSNSGYNSSNVGSGVFYKAYNWKDYIYYSGNSVTGTYAGESDMSKYNKNDNKIVLDSTTYDDAAHVVMGGDWRMPTAEDLQTLNNSVNAIWTDNYQESGVKGTILTDKTDNSKILFFPAGGCASNTQMQSINAYCMYWSSSIYTTYITKAISLYFGKDNFLWDFNRERCQGCLIRGVIG